MDSNSEFRKKSIQMMQFHETSIIGYVATLFLSFRIVEEQKTANSKMDDIAKLMTGIIQELINKENRSRSTMYWATFFLTTIGMMERELRELHGLILDIVHEEMMPTLTQQFRNNTGIISFLAIVAEDIDKYWPKAKEIFKYMFKEISKCDQDSIDKFGDILIAACFYPEIGIGVNLIDYFFSGKIYEDKRWKTCCNKVMAGMLVRNPEQLRSILTRHIKQIGDLDRTLIVIREAQSSNIAKLIREFRYLSPWNKFITHGLFKVKLRYFLVKILGCGLAQSNSVEEFAKEFRRFVIEVFWGFAGINADINYEWIEYDKALSETESQRKENGGILYEPNK